MAIKNLNNRRLLNKDEEDERKASGKLFLPTYEELAAIEEKAKEDAAKAASSENPDLRSALKTFVEREGRLPEIAPGQTVSRSEAPLLEVKQTENNRTLMGLTNLGAGFASGATSAAQGAENIIKDVFTGGEQGAQINAIERYLGEHASERDTLMRSASYDEDRAVAKIAKSAGVSESSVRDYKKNNYASYIKQSNDAWADENDLGTVEKFLLGDAAYQVGQQLPGMMLGAAGQFSQGGTLVGSVKDAVTAAKGTGAANMVKAIGEGTVKGILNAAKGNLTTNLMALNTAGSNFFQNQQQYGDQRRVVSNLVDSAAQGFLEQFTEHLGGFTDIGSVGTFLDSRSGSTAKTLAKTLLKAGLGMAEEGAEEIINAPLGNIMKKITFEPDKAWFGEGGVFDIKEMAKAGATGSLLGGLMGGVGTVATIADVVMPANKSLTGNVLAIEANAENFNPAEIRAAVDVLNRTAEEFGVAPIADARAATISDVQTTSAEILDAVRERAEGIKTSDPAAAETAQDTFAHLRNTNPDFGEIERTGRVSGAQDDDIRMAGELSTALGKKIRFFRQEAKNGTINNGEYHESDGTIWINAASKNVKAQIVAHELTHSIEKNEGYQQLVNLAMDKLGAEQKAKGKTIDDLYREKEMLYADGNVRLGSYDEITSELVAEFVEKRLLTDEASIKSLVQENRTLGQRIREWFDSLLAKMGNASAKEREYIRQMRDVYAKALGEDVGADGENAVKHDIAVTDDGKMYVTASRNVITGKNINEQRAQVTKFFKELLQNKPSLDITTAEGDVLTLTMAQTEHKARNNEKQENGNKIPLTDTQFAVKLRAETHIDEIAEISKKDSGKIKKDAKNRVFSKDGFSYRTAYFMDFDGKYYEIKLSVGHNGSTATVYNVTQKESTPPTAKLIAVVGSQPRGMLSGDSIPQNGRNVKGQNAGNGQHSVSRADEEAVKRNTPGVKDAEETEQINKEIERVDLEYDSESGTVYHSFSSLEDAFDYNKGEEDYRAARNEYAYALAKATGKTYAQAQQYLDDLFLIHDLIGDDRDRLDYVAAVDRSSWVGNVEYGGSIDFSTLCAKRRLFTGTFDAIQQALPDTVLNENDFLRIRELLVEKGLESPCSMCYVEGSRAKHGVYVERFLRDYLATDPEWRPQIADFTSTTRLEQTRIQHPEAYKAYTDAMNKLSQRKPKEASVRTDYKGEILRAFKNDGNVNEKNLMGGIRFNSFSDFEIIHAIDAMQVLTDMARVGLNGQSYTKQKEFAEAFGNTGLKINLSLVAKDVDADGRLVFDEVNGMKESEAMDIRDRYSENVGTVIVVFNEAQLRAALADERIDFVLPFHRSQWKKSQYTMMGLPTETRDFTNIQNDRMKNPKTGRAKKVDGGNIMPNQYWDHSLDGRGNAQLYLDYINEHGYIPKFDFLLSKQDGKWVLPEGSVGDGYFKLLIDFKMYDNDGNGAPQRPVTPDFNMPYITQMLEDYKGGHGSFPVANDIVDAFVREKQSGRVKHSVSRAEDPLAGKSSAVDTEVEELEIGDRTDGKAVTDAEVNQTLQSLRGDIAVDEERYRELSEIVLSNERFNALIPDEQTALLSEMEQLRARIDQANRIAQDMTAEADAGEDVPVPGDEDVPTVQMDEAQNNVSADAARYKEITDLIKDKAKFGSMTADERTAIFDEMNEILARNVDAKTDGADRDIKTVYERTEQQKQNAENEMASIRLQQQQEIESRQKKIDDLQKRYDSKKNKDTKEAGRLFRQIEREKRLMADMEADYAKRISDLKERIGKREAYMEHYLETRKPETPDERLAARKKKREERKTVAKAETAFKRLGYDIEGAIVDNYEDAAGIIEDNSLAAQAESDINKYIKDNQIQFYVDNTAKLLARGDLKPENVALKGDDLTQAKTLADMYRQFMDLSDNSIREQGKKNTNIVNDRLDQILGGYDWYSEPKKSRKFWRQQLQLSLSNPEQVIRDVFGEGAVADELNDYIVRPTIENSARARRQTNQMVSGLRDLGLSEAESAVTQIFSEYSNLEESGSKKAVLSESSLRELLSDSGDADANAKKIYDIAEQIAATEYGDKESKEKKDFRDSIIEQLQNEMNVNQSRARQRALRDYKEQGGTAVSWNALSEDAKKAKIDAAYKTVTDESIERIVNGTKELRKLLDDMYDAINQISVIHGAAPISFRKGYMPHSHKQTEELQKWFNDHMGGLNVTPVQDLPTDIAGKTADRKPNKRWFSHAQQRTGPRTTWDALGNIEDYLRIANDTIYHMDDIRKMRVLERYIRGIYSAARGATGEEQRTRVRNDVMQRLHGEDIDLVFLGLAPPEKKQNISDEDMDLSQMTTFVTWLTNYTNDLAAKQIFNRDIESFAGRKVNNLANTLTSWSSRTMMQYNISSNLKQLSQLGSVSGDVGARISKDAAAMTLRSMQNLGNGTNELEQKYHISERSTFLAEKEAIEEATFAVDKDLTAKQKSDRQHAKDIWDYAWSFTDTTMSRYTVYAYFLEGMERGMDDTAALRYADTKARNILASRMKGSSPLIFQSKNPILRMFTLFQREPLAAWQDIIKTMPREYQDMKIETDEKTAKQQITKRITGRLLGAGIVNTVYATVLGLGTPAMFDILGEPLRALFDKLWKEITPDEEDDITWEEAAERFISGLGDEIADDIPFANVVSLISNTYAGTEFESRLALNVPDIKKIFGLLGLGGKAAWNGAQLLWSDDAEDIELLEEISTIPGQIPVAILDMITEIVGTAAPAGNQLRKSAKGLIAVLRSGEYTKDGQLKYEVGGVGESIRAVLLGSSNTRAGQEWIASGFDSLSKTETEAYKALIEAGVSEKKARQYVERVAEAEKIADETQAQAEARMIDGMNGLTKAQKAELYYDMVATDSQIGGIDAAVAAGADIADAVETARAIRDSKKKLDKLTALQASDMDTDEREEMYLAMMATKIKDDEGNVIGTEDDELLKTLYATGLDFDDFLDAKQMQSRLNADDSLSASQRANRYQAWIASQGYTDEQAQAVSEEFGFASGFRVEPKTYQKIVDGGVTPENAVKVTDALTGTSRSIDKINAIWSTGLSGEQLDLAVKSVLTEKAYEKYRNVIDANIPLGVYTWALNNADLDAEGEKGHGSINNAEREAVLSRLDLTRKEKAALWLALGGSEKSNPYSGTGRIKIEVPKIEVPKVEVPKINIWGN